MSTLVDYYEQQSDSASFRDLEDREAWEVHAAWRAAYFRERLGLPAQFFRGLRMAEVGSGTGENALAFLHWGARVTAVEPLAKGHRSLLSYIDRFGFDRSRIELSRHGFETFEADAPYDFINAEGFVATLEPAYGWLARMDALLTEQGLFHVSYYERAGSFVDQAVSALAQTMSLVFGESHEACSRALMERKWKPASGRRPFRAWYVDTLANPFARYPKQVAPAVLLAKAAESKFSLRASVPSYREGLRVGWYRERLSLSDEVARSTAHELRARTGFALGHQCFWTGPLEELASATRALDALLKTLHAAIVTSDADVCRAVADAVRAWVDALSKGSERWLCDRDLASTLRGLRGLAEAFDAALRADRAQVMSFARDNPWYLGTWGVPVHFALFARHAP